MGPTSYYRFFGQRRRAGIVAETGGAVGGQRRGKRAAVGRPTGLPIVRILLAVLAIVVAMTAAVFWVATGEDPAPTDPPSAGSSATWSPSGAPPSLAQRYLALGEDIDAGTDECREKGGRVAAGIEDRVVCRVRGGTLELTTYAALTDLDEVREGVLDPRVGSLMSARDDGSYYALDPARAEGDAVATVYWDDHDALQSARLVGSEQTSLKDLLKRQQATIPSVSAPTDPDADQLGAFAENYRLRACSRVPVSVDGAVEESSCRHDGDEVRLGRFDKSRGLQTLRATMERQVERDLTGFEDFWYYDTNGKQGHQRDERKQGKVFGFYEGDEVDARAVLYVDDTTCGCYLLLRATDTDPRTLFVQLY